MDFDEFWKELRSELKQKVNLKTLKQNKKFSAHFDHNKKRDLFVSVRPEHGKPRGQIPYNEFEGVWDTAKAFPPETRFVNKGGRLEAYTKQDNEIGKTVHVSYITALIDYIVKDQSME